MGFDQDGIRRIDYTISKAGIKILKKSWLDFTKNIKPYPENRYRGRGIVYTAGGVSNITCLLISINVLRKQGCDLPIEVWFLGNEIPEYIQSEFKGLGVTFKNFLDFEKISFPGFHLKPLCILYSSFEEVLFLDSDNICLKNPTFLFDSDEYKRNGCIFWPDFWKTDITNPIWEIVGSNDFNQQEQESGQILINKSVCWKELGLTIFFNKHSKYYYNLLYGDKDTFKFSWIALGKSYHMVKAYPKICGFFENDDFYGNTIVQHDLHGNMLFLHRNLIKWDITLPPERIWTEIKYYHDNADVRQIIFKEYLGKPMLDFQGEYSIEKASMEIEKLE